MIPIELAQTLIPDLEKLTVDQFAWVTQVTRSMALPFNSNRSETSDVVPSDRALGLFFLYLVTHHALSSEPFKKEKFEFAVLRIMEQLGIPCSLPKSRTNPGLDITVRSERWSFKSEAHKGIRPDSIWISKWMELGKGQWGSNPADLRMLCSHFLKHLEGYDRIFILRCLTPDAPHLHHYELLEIPKSLLLLAPGGEFTMMQDSKQNPKPGYCRVRNQLGLPIFNLYFDGGSERKLQIKDLRRDVCIFHAQWKFSSLNPGNVISSSE